MITSPTYVKSVLCKLEKKFLISNTLFYITQMYRTLIEFNRRKGNILLSFSISKRNWSLLMGNKTTAYFNFFLDNQVESYSSTFKFRILLSSIPRIRWHLKISNSRIKMKRSFRRVVFIFSMHNKLPRSLCV